jgi:hypothetical protein
MLIRNDIVFFLRINGLVHGGHTDFIIWEPVLAEVLEEVCVA